ncbi:MULTISPECIES: GntR family transcriptional regulator [Enterococcus]|uniref:HTH gntR-type domain-containing protein n=1 Tax=Candidatus Enterococcus ferrettii TaxID=2815324 RepID=A0ABV0ETF7_9ENTE|nr:GntR family transcriptional regulator [Enterococcus sp. 665A]MBO1341052.1 GntR family transcriptional regulator [Enterococcus sp. 665A]
MNFAEDRPIYLQIMDEIIQQIIAGKLKPGEKISAVREMAVQLSTNPNTVQRSLQELERMNILYSERGKGRFVTSNQTVLENLNQEKVAQVMNDYLSNMKHLGFSTTEALEKLQHFIEEDQE